MGPHWPQDGPYGVPTVVWRHNRNFHFFWKNRWRKFEFRGMVNFTVLTHFLDQWDPIGPKMDPRGSPPWFGAITADSIFCEKSKICILGHGNFLRFWPIFWTQWDPIGPKMGPRGSPPWFGAITVTSIFCEKPMTAGQSKIRIVGHGYFYGFDPFFRPRGTPFAPRWTLGGPHRDLAP